ncbi:DUF3040 domain-containing protein [Klenkia sp. PcliD-1-E]|uniref:DUF3040 domain-containing protein n=1 Tax=Klenkia sp. PcliD-1-E TaxID=2954492 RepID=UPI00209730D4|nr:DUF3040 domain-containing protein [Klenkia sp. PcliD-1-E]MCO7218362.1 DUF3040 domain-containing protein [Klenkia sp. PcliD-1-E]
MTVRVIADAGPVMDAESERELAALADRLRADDPRFADRLATSVPAAAPWPVQTMTWCWILLTSALVTAYLWFGNSAALVLATTLAVLYPAGLLTALRLRASIQVLAGVASVDRRSRHRR